ncbi:DUF1737 domain-containing protein [Motiliproteus coralliicola]|uniref:DUF1737 domain-containing protein n=1 Tax=Motiliproteus coralliicola TaxID=2283196 RepID=A0A369WVM0_9GAMM|nr:DUF1737 domain-containing protein [Motiliproteus coralliicola]
MKYVIVTGRNSAELTASVKTYLKAGWVPQGGIAVRPGTSHDSPLWSQAMVCSDG